MDEPQINTGTPLSSVASDIGGSKPMDTATYKKGLSTVEKGLESNIEERKKIPSATPPQLEKEPELKNFQTDPWQSFGSFAGVLATVGSLMTRRPLTNALNAGAAVMNAKSKGDYESYKSAFDRWKISSDNAYKMADWNQSQVKDLYERLKDNHSDLTAEMEVLAKATQDPGLEHAIKAMDLQNAVASRDKAVIGLNKERDAIQLQHDLVTDKVQDWKEKNGVTEDKNVPSKVFHDSQLEAKREVEAKGSQVQGPVTWSEASIEKAADGIHGGLRPNIAVPGLGKNNPNRDAAVARWAEKYPDDDMADIESGYAGKTSEARAVGTASGKLTLSANLLDKALPLARDAVKKVDLTRFPSINALENAARTHTGNPELAAANTALQTVMSDYSALIARNGTSTDATRGAARELVNQNMAKGQLNAVFDQMEKEKDQILEGVKETRGSSPKPKKPTDAHIRMLRDDHSDQAKSEFDEVYGEGAADKVLGGK